MNNSFSSILKKALLYLLIPSLSSCYLGKRVVDDDLYYNNKQNLEIKLDSQTETARQIKNRYKNVEDYVNSGEDKNAETYWRAYFSYSTYSSFLGVDSDGDGIINYDDPCPYEYGPFIDMNNNGIVDPFDVRIGFFHDPYFYDYPYHSHYRWLNGHPHPIWIANPHPNWANYYEYNTIYITDQKENRVRRHREETNNVRENARDVSRYNRSRTKDPIINRTTRNSRTINARTNNNRINTNTSRSSRSNNRNTRTNSNKINSSNRTRSTIRKSTNTSRNNMKKTTRTNTSHSSKARRK